MPDDGIDSSLSARVRSLALAPDFKEVMLELTERLEQATAVAAVLARADAPAPLPPPGPKHRRDRRGFRVINGGMGAFAPAVFLGHDATVARGAVVAFLRWLFCRERRVVQMAVAALAFGLAGAVAAPTAAGPLPHAHAVTGHHGRSPLAPALMPGRPVLFRAD